MCIRVQMHVVLSMLSLDRIDKEKVFYHEDWLCVHRFTMTFRSIRARAENSDIIKLYYRIHAPHRLWCVEKSVVRIQNWMCLLRSYDIEATIKNEKGVKSHWTLYSCRITIMANFIWNWIAGPGSHCYNICMAEYLNRVKRKCSWRKIDRYRMTESEREWMLKSKWVLFGI